MHAILTRNALLPLKRIMEASASLMDIVSDIRKMSASSEYGYEHLAFLGEFVVSDKSTRETLRGLRRPVLDLSFSEAFFSCKIQNSKSVILNRNLTCIEY